MNQADSMLRECYEVMGACGMVRPPWEAWSKHVTENAEVWPIRKQVGDDMRIIGFVLFKAHTIHIAVLPEWRGRWITKTMLRIWRTQYEHDCDLYATPAADNAEAIALAERLGFERRGRAGQSLIFVKPRTTNPQLEAA